MRRSTVILLILFLLLGGLVWYMQQPGNPIKRALATSTTVASAPLDSLVNVEKGPVSRISVQSAEGKSVSLDKVNGQWNVTAGNKGLANPDQAEAAASQAVSIRLITKLAEIPDTAGSGLNNPSFTISFTLGDGTPFTFKVGKETVTGSGYYVQTPDGSVVVANKNSIDALTALLSNPPFLQTSTPTPG